MKAEFAGAAPEVGMVGIGFGPAGTAVAVALHDDHEFGVARPGSLGLGDALFLERAPSSAWQPDMLLPGTDVQHHFLRDFATPRYPRSRFTFVNYVHAMGRFYPFTLRGGYVSRAEWSDYCSWVAGTVGARVRYSTRAEAVEPCVEGGRIRHLNVHTVDQGTGRHQVTRTRRVVVSTGHEPYVPEAFRDHLGARVFHSSTFSSHWQPLAATARRVAVVGGGQNAGEVLLHLAQTAPAVDLHSLVRNSGFRLYDLGHFSNQAYWPEETEYFYALDEPERRRIFAEQYRTNYACVDPDVSTGLYEAWYSGRISGRQKLLMHKRTEVVRLRVEGAGVRLHTRELHTGAQAELVVDAVVVCTGYREPSLPRMLEPLADHVQRTSNGEPEIGRDFALDIPAADGVSVHLNGLTERRHGIASATSFSLLAIRAGEITAALRSAAPHPRTPSVGREVLHA